MPCLDPFGAAMKRREFIKLVGGAATALPLTALAQQQMPLVGFLNSASPDTYRFNADSFREGLTKAGFVEGKNVRIEERWARGDYDALPALAAELVAKGVVAIAATGDVASARAAQRASNTVPVVFTIGGDPVRFGLVKSINRPGGNVTGILFNQNVLGAKRVELLREIAPSMSRVALLLNPTNPNVKVEQADAEAGAKKLGLETVSIACDECAGNERGARAVIKCQGRRIHHWDRSDPAGSARADWFVRPSAQAPRCRFCSAVRGSWRALRAIGPSISWMYRQAGEYVGQILKGSNPAEMPVLQPTQFELVINLKTAKDFGLTIPPTFLARADEVIE